MDYEVKEEDSLRDKVISTPILFNKINFSLKTKELARQKKLIDTTCSVLHKIHNMYMVF